MCAGKSGTEVLELEGPRVESGEPTSQYIGSRTVKSLLQFVTSQVRKRASNETVLIIELSFKFNVFNSIQFHPLGHVSGMEGDI